MSDAWGPPPLPPATARGCICPPTSERTCRAPICPRQGAGQPNDELAAAEERISVLEDDVGALKAWVEAIEAGSKQALENMRRGL